MKSLILGEFCFPSREALSFQHGVAFNVSADSLEKKTIVNANICVLIIIF